MTHPSSNPSSSRDASTVAAAATRRFASRVDGRHTSLGHARKETTTTTTTMRGTTTTTVASSSSSSLSSSTLVADARGRRAVSRCAVRRVDARREEPKIQPRRRTGTATTRETRERSSRAHRSTHASRHRHRANSVVFETPVATTKQTTRETRPAALGVRSSSRASTRRTDDDARDRRDVDAIARGRRREDEKKEGTRGPACIMWLQQYRTDPSAMSQPPKLTKTKLWSPNRQDISPFPSARREAPGPRSARGAPSTSTGSCRPLATCLACSTTRSLPFASAGAPSSG